MPATASGAAAALAGAYHDYATQATVAGSSPTLPDAKRDALAGTLLGAIAAPATGLPATFAAAWAAGVGVYWTAVVFAGGTPATVPSCPGAAGLTGALTPVFANLANTSASAASSLAAALHTATTSCIATLGPPAPPGTTAPIG
jgi:hypothetical protein